MYRRDAARSLVFVTLLSGVSCGGGDDSPTQPSPNPGGPGQPSVVTGTVAAGAINAHELPAITVSGGLVVELRWQDASVDLDLYLTDVSCAAYPPTSCTILANSSRTNVNVERINRSVRAGERLKVWVDNFDRTRSQTYQLESVIIAPAGVTGAGESAGTRRMDAGPVKHGKEPQTPAAGGAPLRLRLPGP